jgi:hypothetical protein
MTAAYSGLLFDLLIFPALLWKKTRYIALAAGVGFHLFNSLIFDIEVFPWLALVATLLFLRPDWPRLGGQWRRLSSEEASPVSSWKAVPPLQKILGGVLAVYFLFQLLIPLRPFLYPGNTQWTGEGYFFTWRMLIASKDGRAQYHITDKSSGTVCRVQMLDYIAAYQSAKVTERPDMMVQFAHYLKSRFKKDFNLDVEVRVWGELRLNDRPWLQFTDPTVDLTTRQRTLGHHSFLIPLEDARPVEVPSVPRCPSHAKA